MVKDLVFNVQSKFPIVADPSLYKVAVKSFSIPRLNLPLFQMLEDPLDQFNTFYFVSIGIIDVPVQYVPYGSNLIPRAIFYVEEFLQGVNQALVTAHFNNGIAGPPPSFLYESDGRISINIPSGYPQPVFCSKAVYDRFPGIPIYYSNLPVDFPRNYEFVPNVTLNNQVVYGATTYTKLLQDTPTLEYSMDQYKRLAFISNRLAIEETLLAVNEVNENISGLYQHYTTYQNGDAFRDTDYSYQSDGEYIWHDMKNDKPIYTISIGVYWKNDKGILTPLPTFPGDFSNLTIIFQKKSVHEQKKVKEYEFVKRNKLLM
jgi:hypothetical protein